MDEPNTHGFEMEENEHDVVDKVYLDIKPRPQLSELLYHLETKLVRNGNLDVPIILLGKPLIILFNLSKQ